MILKRIVLKNYRQYRNTTIEIPDVSEEAHIAVVVGRMGFGKTNILNAINWCLYEEEPHLGLKRRALPMLNSSTKAAMTVGETADVEVSLVFMDEGIRTEICRKKRFRKTKNGTIKEEKIGGGLSSLSVGYLSEKDYEYYDYPQLYIERVMPETLSSYFMFDGEKLDKYFLEQTVSKIRGAIHGISKLNLFDKVVDKLEKTKKDFKQSYSDPTPQMKSVQKRIDELSNEIDTHKEKLEDIIEQEDELRDLKSDLDSALRSSNIEVIREKQKRRELLTQEKKEKEQRLDDLENRRKRLIIEDFSLAVSKNTIDNALKLISEGQEGYELPAPFRNIFIEHLIETAECICGRDIKEGSEEEEYLKKKMEENIVREATSTMLPLLISDLHELSSQKRGILDQLSSVNGKIDAVNGEITEIGLEIEDIHTQIKDFDDIDIVQLEKREAEVKKQIEDLTTEKIAIKGRIKERERERDENETKLDQYQRSIAKYEKLNKRKDLCSESLEIGQDISEQVLDSIRKQVDKVTSEQGLIAINDTKVESISIGNDFMTSVKFKEYGMEDGIGGLSAGQRASLALTFLHALNSVSVWETPIIIDTPLGRIDLKDREPLLNVLKEQMKGKQIIILMTSAEYTEQERNALSPVLLAEYEIVRNQDGTSEVKEYG